MFAYLHLFNNYFRYFNSKILVLYRCFYRSVQFIASSVHYRIGIDILKGLFPETQYHKVDTAEV